MYQANSVGAELIWKREVDKKRFIRRPKAGGPKTGRRIPPPVECWWNEV
jgi:hypothetical protein